MLRPQRHEGVKLSPFYKTPFNESSTNPSKHIDPEQNYLTTKKNWRRDHTIFKGGESEERDDFYFGKKPFQQKKDLYKSKINIQ